MSARRGSGDSRRAAITVRSDLEQEPGVARGSVAVDLFETKTHVLPWHASARRAMTQLTGAKADRRIRSAVNARFDQLPDAGW